MNKHIDHLLLSLAYFLDSHISVFCFVHLPFALSFSNTSLQSIHSFITNLPRCFDTKMCQDDYKRNGCCWCGKLNNFDND